jgi:GT2 family glycosyltransferase
MTKIGIVVIGRNEGRRLEACLRSVFAQTAPIVYVDSGSTDGSVEFAESLSVNVVELDMSIPFTAGRARNEGFEKLCSLHPDVECVQFIDGDCILAEGWLCRGVQFLQDNPSYAVVAGRVRESNRLGSIYNRLLDMEWHVPPGESTACGGIALMRRVAVEKVGGFNPSLVAGEEPELCLRLRQNGWKVMRLDAEMTLHDADMHRFGQWWRRTKRGGFAYALGASIHGKPPERHWVRETRSALVWGLAIPALILILAALSRGWGLLLFSIYPLQVARIAHGRMRHGESLSDAWLYGMSCMVAKFAEAAGILKFYRHRLFGQQATIIEYK